MSEPPSITSAIQLAVAHLSDARICQTVSKVSAGGSGRLTITCGFDLPFPNQGELPRSVSVVGQFTDAFPYGSLDFYLIGEENRGFAHQEATTGKLCLRSEKDVPLDHRRLATYVKFVREWLLDAANGNLVERGDPYELPDFRRIAKNDLGSTDLPTFIDEAPSTFEAWSDRLGCSGRVLARQHDDPNGLFVYRFLEENGDIIRTTSFACCFVEEGAMITGRWVLLPGLVIKRHQPPQTFGELLDICARSGVELLPILRDAWRNQSRNQVYSVLLIGFPIPPRFGEEPAEVHWQPLFFPSYSSLPRNIRRRKKGQVSAWSDVRERGSLANAKQLHWGTVDNLARGRQYARGALPVAVQESRPAVLGCGALGAPLAEALARGGVRQLTLLDKDKVEFGNLCRHTLDGRHVCKSKAQMLADRLQSANPTTRIIAFNSAMPWDCAVGEGIEYSDVLIDCTTDHEAFLWLSDYGRQQRKRIASMFINANATTLTLVMSGKHTSAKKTYRRLMGDIQAAVTPLNADEYFCGARPEEAVLPGTGCWHATFPALNSHIWMLAFAAIEHVSWWLQQHYACAGHGVILARRKQLDGPLVETLWKCSYR